MDLKHGTRKILDWEEASQRARRLQGRGRAVVFTNGCFDILHVGHLRYLTMARGLGNHLVVGLNSDRSVREIKGPTRPLNLAAHRAEVLAGLEVVGTVVVFDQPTPLELITQLRPDVLVKGGDWPIDRIVGREVVLSRGGRVLSLALTPGISTTNLIERIIGGPNRPDEQEYNQDDHD